uniref:Uncharacterized protein n=1 Tax=Cacopsylla melanoneura TaxID=428564 RepID=A0A8D8YLF8_9HEMI
MPIMVNKKSEYKIQFCKYDPEIGKRLWLDNRSLRACRKLTNQETHYWKFQICPEEYECTCTSDEPPAVSKTRQSLLDKHHRAQEIAVQVPDKKQSTDQVDHAIIRERGPSAPARHHLKPTVDEKESTQSKGVQTKTRKTDKTKTKPAAGSKDKDKAANVVTKPPPSPKRRRSQSQLPPRTSRRVYPKTGVDKWKLVETQRQTVRWMSEYQEQFSKHRDEFFSRSPVIRSRPTSAPPCAGLWSRD